MTDEELANFHQFNRPSTAEFYTDDEINNIYEKWKGNDMFLTNPFHHFADKQMRPHQVTWLWAVTQKGYKVQ